MSIGETSRKYWGAEYKTKELIPGTEKFLAGNLFGFTTLSIKSPDTLVISAFLNLKRKPIMEFAFHKEQINDCQQILSMAAKGGLFTLRGYDVIYEWKPTSQPKTD